MEKELAAQINLYSLYYKCKQTVPILYQRESLLIFTYHPDYAT